MGFYPYNYLGVPSSMYPYNYIGSVGTSPTEPVPVTEFDDILEWGIDWLTPMAQRYASQEVIVSWEEGGTARSETCRASLVDEDGRVIPGAVKAAIESTNFMFTMEEINAKNVPLERGVFIEWNLNQYEIINSRNKFVTANDVYQRTIIVSTKHVLNRDRRSHS